MRLIMERGEGVVAYLLTQDHGLNTYFNSVEFSEMQLKRLNSPRSHIAHSLIAARKQLRTQIRAANAVEQHRPVFDYDFLRKLNAPNTRTTD